MSFSRLSHWGGVAALLLALLWLPLRNGGLDVFPLRTVQVLSLFTTALLLFRQGTGGVGRQARPVLLVLAVLTGAATLSTAFSKDLDASVPLLFGWFWLLAAGFLVVSVAREEKPWNLIWGALVAAAAIQSAWSFFVWWGGGFAGASQSGTFYAPNQFAGYLLVLGALPFAAALSVPNRREAVSWGVLTIMIYLSVLLSGSRAGVIAASGGILATLGFALRVDFKKTVIRAAIQVGGFLACAAFVSSAFIFAGSPPPEGATTGLEAKTGSAPGRLSERFHWTQGAILIGATRPLVGTGLGTYGDMLVQVQDPSWSWSRFAHNHYAEAFAEGGIPLFVATLVLPFVALRRPPQTQSSRYWKQYGLWAGLFGGTLHLLLDYDWAFPAYGVSFVIAASLLHTQPHEHSSSERARRPLHYVLASVLLTVSVGVTLNATAIFLIRESPSKRNLRIASRLAPYTSDLLQARASALADSGRRSDVLEAARILRFAADIDKLDPRLVWALAEVEKRLGRNEAARDAYRTGILIAANAPRSYQLAAVFELGEGRPGSAADILDRGIQRLLLRPSESRSRIAGALAQLMLIRALAEEQLTSSSSALRFAQNAADINPRSIAAWLRLAELACNSRQPALARQASAQATHLNRGADLSKIPVECRP